MGYKKSLEKESNVRKIELTGNYFVDVAPKVSYAEARVLSQQSKDSPEDMNIGLIAKCVVAWNLDDDEGVTLPITPENVEALSLGDFSKIQMAVLESLGLQKKE